MKSKQPTNSRSQSTYSRSSQSRPQRDYSRNSDHQGFRSKRENPKIEDRQMRYKVIGRTTDEADLIVQVSPAFYEYIRSMAHQGVKPTHAQREESSHYGKFSHPFHKDPMYSKDKGESERRGGRLEQKIAPKKKPQQDWYDDDADMGDIDAEMDEEYQMIKQGFATVNKNKSTFKRDKR